jgi:hypothetical protein
MAFNLDNYEPVANRLARAHADHPDMRIITNIVDIHRDDNGAPKQYVVMAQVWYGDILKAQDYAEEIVGNGMVNKSSALENALTSAIGRALADANYQGTNLENPSKTRPSREEMQKAQRIQEGTTQVAAPVARVYEDKEITAASDWIDTVANVTDIDELKKIWSDQAALLDIPVNKDTLKAAINRQVAKGKKADK